MRGRGQWLEQLEGEGGWVILDALQHFQVPSPKY